ncbi:CDP-glycerol glycerophosphotransferase family protein [Enterococcus sp. DIV0660C]|uniref:CDP-glycerol glycerophosphotransferase family protein n=1 Tax=Enterococcus sp. DIV0660C TaxID=2230880 RepID=UPI001A8EFCAA|nr:CDP-glycerol glycerophosphotransferase family protein [Enterococcus sp. DIV0660C]MBO0431829.1 CDP-glycerol glycerophosphotransferase family protein [Enterococcus sp. DIV0660C]
MKYECSFISLNNNNLRGSLKDASLLGVFSENYSLQVNQENFQIVNVTEMLLADELIFQIEVDRELPSDIQTNSIVKLVDLNTTIIELRTHNWSIEQRISQENKIPIFDCLIENQQLKFSFFDLSQTDFTINVRSKSGKLYEKIRYFRSQTAGITTISINNLDLIDQINELGRYHFYLETEGKSYEFLLAKIHTKKNKYLDFIYKDATREVMIYASQKTSLSFTIQPPVKMNEFRYHKKAKLLALRKKTSLVIEIKIPIEYREGFTYLLKIQHRGTLTAAYQLEPIKRIGKKLVFSIDLTAYDWAYYYWDLYLECQGEQETYACRIINKSFFLYLKLQYFSGRYQSKIDENIVYPYQTMKYAISLNYRPFSEYETKKYKRNEWIAYVLAHTIGLFFLGNDIWLIHEKYSNTAQDNSYYFFNYLQEKTNQRAYFVIKKESPEYNKLDHYQRRRVDFMSVKHLFLLLIARRVVASESKGHGYAWRVQTGPIKPILDKKRYVFLQHGVLGLKKLDNTFNATRSNNQAELFITSAEWEKKIVQKYLEYTPQNIVVTGLARWDELQKNKGKLIKKKQFLIMPTWRTWLEDLTQEEFIKSDFFQQYSQLLSNQELLKFLEMESYTIIFYIHPKLAEYIQLFDVSAHRNLRIIPMGDVPLNELLSESECLITDYSSIYWEALYQGIPTIFFQFDIEKYQQLQGSYLDLNKELQETRCFDVQSLILEMKQRGYLSNDVNLHAKTIFPYIDNQNSARIFEEIKRYEPNLINRLKQRIKRNRLVEMVRIRINDIVR